jgi:NhaP-type Na+/H+ or K+/H+ antiporter
MLIPPLIVNGAYHMPRDKYLQNFGNIYIISILVTCVCFMINFVGMWWLTNIQQVSMTRYSNSLDPTQPMRETISLKDVPWEYLLMMAASLSCSDMGVCLGCGGLEGRTNLATTIGGECGINPIVCIVTWRIMNNHIGKNFSWAHLVIFPAQLASQIVCILIGAAYGIVCCLLFKHVRFIS